MPEALMHDITGVILVGGKSRRMGRDKAFLEIGGSPLFTGVLELFTASFPQVFLVGEDRGRFADYSVRVLPDLVPGSSLGGLYTALYRASSEWVFVASCDLPFPSPKILEHLCSLKEGYDAVVPRTRHGYEPLYALYAKTCLVPIKAQLDRGECCAYAWYPQVRVREVTQDELDPLDPDGVAFLNLNTPEDVAKIGGAT